MSSWTPSSWRNDELYKAEKQPVYPDPDALDEVLKQLEGLPPLIFAGEARVLIDELARVERGEAFVIQAGDCAETFGDFSADQVRDLLKVILQVAVVLTWSSGVPVVKIGRVAGQFAKPRSADYEMTPDGVEVPTYRGDIINGTELTQEARRPDAERILRAYYQATQTLNLVRGFAEGGFADLTSVHKWNREFVASSREGRGYEAIANGIDSALRFMKACRIDSADMHRTRVYASHEALLLPYEQAMTRQDSTAENAWYDCSAHMLWVGTRTKELDSAHVEFLSGVNNPIGVKIDSKTTVDHVLKLCDRLNPNRQAGRLTLVSRMGKAHIGALGPIIDAVKESGHPVVWLCDPMHGNTIESDGGLKTRRFDDVFEELTGYFEVHRQSQTWPGGIHLELTGRNVTECLGGSSDDVRDDELAHRYQTACDPRLNARQALDLAFRAAELLEGFPIPNRNRYESPEEFRAKLRAVPDQS